MSEQVRIVAFNDPIGSEPVECFADNGQTIEELFPDISSQVEVSVNGNPLHKEYHGCHTLEGGDLVTMVRMPAGDTDTGKSIGRTALILSLQIAAAVATQGASVGWQIAANATATIGGNFLANQVGLVATPDLRNTQRDVTDVDRRGALTGSRNRLAPFAYLPRVYGHMRMYPPMSAQPYTEIQANEQYMRLLFNLGPGPLQISKPKIGETLIGSFDANHNFTSNGNYEGIEIDVAENPDLYTNDVNTESLSVSLNDTDDQAIRTTVDGADEASLDLVFPTGLFRAREDGSIDSASVTYQISYRETGTSEWTAVDLDADSTSRTRGDSSAGFLVKSEAKETYRASVKFKFPQRGQYDVRIVRNTSAGNSDPEQGDIVRNESTLTAFRSITFQQPTDLPGTVQIAMRIKATDQLNGILDEFNVEVKSELSYYDGTQWQHPTFDPDTGTSVNGNGVVTSSPAWILADLFCGDSNQAAVDYSELDAAAFKYWDDNYGTEFQFNSVIDSDVTVKKLADNIASAGRASWGIQDGTYTPILDEPNQSPVQMFTPRNSADFSASKVFLEELHGLKMKFRNADNGWQEDEAIVYQDGYSADGTDCKFDDGTGVCKKATKFQEVQLDGVTSWDQAWKLGRYKLAERILRPEVFTYKTDVEHLRCQRGDVVFMASDVTLWGATWGRVKGITRNASNEIIALTLDQKVLMQSGKNYNIRVRLQDGSFALLSVATDTTETNQITIDTPQVADVNAGDLFAFGEDGGEVVPLKVVDIRPGNDLSATLTLVDQADAIHDADSGDIPAYDPNITKPIDINDIVPPAPRIERIRSDEDTSVRDNDGNFILKVVVAYTIDAGSPSVEVEGRYRKLESPGGWVGHETVEGSNGTITFTGLERGNDYIVQIRSVYRGNTSEWVDIDLEWEAATGDGDTIELEGGDTLIYEDSEGYFVVGKKYPPRDVTNFTAVIDKTNVRLAWDAVNSPDIREYEIREGQSWEIGDLVDRTDATVLSVEIGEAKTRNFHIKAIDTTGNYSDSAASRSIEIPEEFDELGNWYSYIQQTANEIVLKVQSDGRLAQVAVKGEADGGTEVTLEADSIDIKSVKTAINAEDTVDIIADDININNINFDKEAGTIGSDNYDPGNDGWQIDGDGNAEFNKVEVRNGLVEGSDIQDLIVKGDIKNTNGDYVINVDGFTVKENTSGGVNDARSYTFKKDDGTIQARLYTQSSSVQLTTLNGEPIVMGTTSAIELNSEYVNLPTASSAPSNNTLGNLWVDSSDNTIYFHDGSNMYKLNMTQV